MKKIALFIAVVAALIGLSVAWSTLWVQASFAPNPGPVNTPAAPEGNVEAVVHQLPSAVTQPRSQEPLQPEARVPEQAAQDEAYVQRALQHAQALRLAGKRFSVKSPGVGAGGLASPQSGSAAGVQCVNALMNPQMDVIEFGVTGTVDSWINMWQVIYFDNTVYRSALHSLVMIDDYVYGDTASFTTTFDYDEFGQGFQAPSGLVSVTVTYSRLYSNTNPGDTAYGNLWTLDSQGYLDELIDYWEIGDTPAGWSDRAHVVPGAELAALSGKPLAFTFDMINDKVSPYEWIWLDDTQVSLCYTSGPVKVYLPVVLKSPPSGPYCAPLEPDSVNVRGSTMVGATCNGSFSFTDIKDYYSLNLGSVSSVRLCLTHLPAGSNWDALIYKDSGGSPYPLRCQIGTAGSGDKCRDCTLNTSENLFVLVSAGSPPPAGTNTYQMSVVSQSAPPSGWATILSENFEGSFPGAWQVASNGGYSWGKRNCKPYAGSYSGWAVGGGASGAALSCGAYYPNNVDTVMTYGPFSLVGATAGDLKFKLWLNSESGYDGVCWYASIDGNNFSGTCTSGNTSGWIDRVLDLANAPTLGNLMGRSSVWIALRFISDGSNTYPEGAFVDDIVLRKCTSASCPATSSITTDSGNGHFVDVPSTSLLPRIR